MSHLSLTLSPGPFNSIKSTLSFKQINNFNLETKDWKDLCNYSSNNLKISIYELYCFGISNI